MIFDSSDWKREFSKTVTKLLLSAADETIGPSSAKPTKLFHYTSSHGVEGIVSRNHLRASHIYYMNDESEYVHAIGLMEQAVAQHDRSDDFPAALKEAISNNLAEAKTVEGALPIFITSFSTKENDLSQWRAYGQGEGGFALAFDFESLSQSSGYLLPCVYKPELQQKIVHQSLEAVIKEWNDHVPPLPAERQALATQRLVVEAFRQLALIATALKSNDFRDEEEWRLVFYQADKTKIFIEAKDSLLSAYTLPKLFEDERRLPLKELWIGPGRYQRLSHAASRVLLDQNSFTGVKIFSSEVPYRVVGKP